MLRNLFLAVGAAIGAIVLVACGRNQAPEQLGSSVTTPLTSATETATPVLIATPAAPSNTAAAQGPTASPAPTPSGSSGRIVFSSIDGSIYTVAADGSEITLIAEPAGIVDSAGFRGAYAWPVWSPDGETVLYSALLPDGRNGLDVSLRTVPASGGGELLVFQDDPATSGIGSGVAHFAYWSPDSRRIALIAGTATGLIGEVINVASGDRVATLADGAPIYYSWASDSRRILVHHQEFLRLYEFDEKGDPIGSPHQLGSGSLDYYAPTFSPSGDRVLYGESSDAGTSVFAAGFDASPRTLMMQTRGRAAFAWAPDGRRVAIFTEELDGLFNRLTVMTAGGRQLFQIDQPSMISFWWAPDGDRLALTGVDEDSSGNKVMAVTVVDVRDQSQARVAELLPSDEFLFMQAFFDQFAHSMRMWSPDSRYLLLFGEIGDSIGRTAAYTSAQSGERGTVWVIDVTGASDPLDVGDGYIGSWSPK